MMRRGSEKKPSWSVDCEVGLGLKMQTTDSYSCGGFFSRSSNPPAGNVYGLADGAGMGVCGKALFTASQWQELERQNTIHKYIMASVPVPPQLLLPSSRSPPPTSLSQCNTSGGLDFTRFSTGGSDPEPWRCKRTDGKKWRCSRDVAPEHKYCERHAHKSRPRSRKLVELQSHKSLIPSSTNTPQQPPCQFPTLTPPTSYDQNRCIEWLMKSGSNTNCVSTHKQQQQWETAGLHLSPSSNSDHNKNNIPAYNHYNNPHIQDKLSGDHFMSPYIPDTSNLHNHPKTTTRHFIDAWGEKESSSLSLSMCGGGGGNLENDKGNMGMISWMNTSPPGGPLGEALCLGNATTTRGGSNLGSPSPHGYGYNNSSSKSCSEDGTYALNFIG